MKSNVPKMLRAMLVALGVSLGAGGAYVAVEGLPGETQSYVQAVASDTSTSEAVKVAMVMGSFYESSGKHLGTPYIDNLGAGRPLTVCNGITGAGVVAGKTYTPAECYQLEKGRYLSAEKVAIANMPDWRSYTVLQQAVFIDFIHNKGVSAFLTSTMLRDAKDGRIVKACRENLRWTLGTVNGVKQILPGLKTRADSNAELCEVGL